MTQHTCMKCDGAGEVCGACGRPRERHGRWSSCRRWRKPAPCPGSKGEPHFATWTECDVCRVRKTGPFYVRTLSGLDAGGWGKSGHLTDAVEPISLCPDCLRRHEEIKAMALEKLKEERGQLRAGETWTGTPPAPR